MAKAEKTEKKSSAGRRKTAKSPGRSRRWTVLALVAAWMFVLGVLVGRGTAPVHFDIEALQTELASLREAVREKEKNRFRITDDEAAKSTNQLDFYENLKKSGPAPAGDAVAKDKSPAAAAPEKKPAAPPRPAERENKSAPERPPAGTKPYTVQVSSLKQKQDADVMVDRLRASGFPAYRETADLKKKGIWHRVRIGSFSSPADAAQTIERLKSARLKPMLIKR